MGERKEGKEEREREREREREIPEWEAGIILDLGNILIKENLPYVSQYSLQYAVAITDLRVTNGDQSLDSQVKCQLFVVRRLVDYTM